MIPNNFYRYKQMPIWNQNTIPQTFFARHNTRAGVYGKIYILEGSLEYTIFESESGPEEKTITISAGDFGVATPQQWHKVRPKGDVKIMLEFYKEKSGDIQNLERKFEEKYPDKSPHYEVKYLVSIIEKREGKKVLDLGCGGGRNSLYLAFAGYDVHAFDINENALLETKAQAEKNGLSLEVFQKDLNTDRVEENYDIVISTVALQFLEKNAAKELILSAQKHTNTGGYHLIIVPIISDDIEAKIPFPNLVSYDKYLDLYAGWDVFYKDNFLGKFHRRDEQGHFIVSRFATIIARKK